jgi:hypothetical protein
MPPVSVENEFENAKHHQPCRNTVSKHQLITRLKLGGRKKLRHGLEAQGGLLLSRQSYKFYRIKKAFTFFTLVEGGRTPPAPPGFKNYFLFFLTIQGGPPAKTRAGLIKRETLVLS